MYKIPIEKSVIAKPGPKGTMAQPNKLKTKVETGAKKNKTLLAWDGIMVSLRINFNASATVS